MELQAGLMTPGPMGRVKASDALVHGAAELMDLVGPAALLTEGSPGAEAAGAIEFAHRFAQGTATYGGTVEVFRQMIAQHGMLGRSEGCFAFGESELAHVMERLGPGRLIYADKIGRA